MVAAAADRSSDSGSNDEGNDQDNNNSCLRYQAEVERQCRGKINVPKSMQKYEGKYRSTCASRVAVAAVSVAIAMALAVAVTGVVVVGLACDQ